MAPAATLSSLCKNRNFACTSSSFHQTVHVLFFFSLILPLSICHLFLFADCHPYVTKLAFINIFRGVKLAFYQWVMPHHQTKCWCWKIAKSPQLYTYVKVQYYTNTDYSQESHFKILKKFQHTVSSSFLSEWKSNAYAERLISNIRKVFVSMLEKCSYLGGWLMYTAALKHTSAIRVQ